MIEQKGKPVLDINKTVRDLALEICEKAGLKPGQTVIVGCSSSEILGHHIGTQSNAEIGVAVFDGFCSVFSVGFADFQAY